MILNIMYLDAGYTVFVFTDVRFVKPDTNKMNILHSFKGRF